MHFSRISGHYELYDCVCIYDMSGVDFAGETNSIVQRDSKMDVAPNWATVYFQLEIWANAQRDRRPAEYRWRPLFNAAKFD